MTWSELFKMNMKIASIAFLIGAAAFFSNCWLDGMNPVYGLFGVLDLILAYLCYTWNPETGFERKDNDNG